MYMRITEEHLCYTYGATVSYYLEALNCQVCYASRDVDVVVMMQE